VQFVDDILDFTGSSSLLGKPALNDLASGITTAPVRRSRHVPRRQVLTSDHPGCCSTVQRA